MFIRNFHCFAEFKNTKTNNNQSFKFLKCSIIKSLCIRKSLPPLRQAALKGFFFIFLRIIFQIVRSNSFIMINNISSSLPEHSWWIISKLIISTLEKWSSGFSMNSLYFKWSIYVRRPSLSHQGRCKFLYGGTYLLATF